MLCGVVGCVGDDGVCKYGFPVDGSHHVCACFVDGYVQIIYGLVYFCFCSEV